MSESSFAAGTVVGALVAYIVLLSTFIVSGSYPRHQWQPLCEELAVYKAPVEVAREHPICESAMVEILLNGGDER